MQYNFKIARTVYQDMTIDANNTEEAFEKLSTMKVKGELDNGYDQRNAITEAGLVNEETGIIDLYQDI